MEKVYTKIIVGIDQSKQSYRAFQRAARLAKEHPDSELYLLAVLPPNANNLQSPKFVEDGFDDWTMSVDSKPLSRQIAEMLAAYEQEAYELGVKLVDYQIQVGGEPKLELIQQVIHPETSVIVVGATTKSTFQKLVLGSVSSYIVKNTPCDIYIIR
ncbi:MAG: universal stress protein [Culicoidibacterales bacterium]